MVYYFSIAAAVWLVIFAYSWSVYITATPMKAREVLAGRDAYFHMAAWSLPLVLTILVMATNKVRIIIYRRKRGMSPPRVSE